MKTSTVINVALDRIRPNQSNPRKRYDDNAINELADSIQSVGVLQPILLRPIGPEEDFFEIVYGFRRYTAAQRAGLKEIPAMVNVLSDEEIAVIQITENLQREDVHPMDEALAIAKLRDELSMSLDEISKVLGRSKSYIATRARLLELIPEFRQLLEEGILPISHALKVCVIEASTQEAVYEDLFKERDKWWSLPTLKALRTNIDRNSGDLSEATWAMDDNGFDHAGPCSSCEFNTANSSLFPDIEEPSCTKIKCFNLKKAAVIDRKLAEIKADPTAVIVTTKYQLSAPLITKIAKEGTEVRCLGDDFQSYENKPELPTSPDPSEYDLNDDEIKAEYESDLQSYQADLEQYNRDLEEYHAKVDSGMWRKAYCVYGSGIIEEIIVKPKANQKAEAGQVTDATPESKASYIKAEISELEDKRQRQQEIALEKIYDGAKTIFGNREVFNYALRPEPLNEDETTALFMALFSSVGYAFSTEISDNIAKRYQPKSDGLFALYDTISNLNEFQKNMLIRAFIASHLQVSLGKDSGAQTYSIAKSFVRVVKSFFPQEMEELTAQEQDKAGQKISKIDAKIEELRNQVSHQ